MTLVAVDRQGKRNALEFFMEPEAAAAVAAVATAPQMSGRDLGLGNYYALVVGNQNYQKLPRLNTPEADAGVIGALLKDRYGFNVTILLNATRLQMLDELNKLQKLLTEKDNLLIYYAGHGEYDRVNSLANWLPIDAEPDNDSNWIQSSRLTEKLNTFQAKHILVVADSCYSGAMTRSSIGQVQPELDRRSSDLSVLKAIAASPSRTVLTSGGVSPVMDGGGGRHSVFAQNFIDVLIGEPGHPAGQAALRRAGGARRQHRPPAQFRAASGIRADPLRGRRVRRFPVRADEDLRRGEPCVPAAVRRGHRETFTNVTRRFSGAPGLPEFSGSRSPLPTALSRSSRTFWV